MSQVKPSVGVTLEFEKVLAACGYKYIEPLGQGRQGRVFKVEKLGRYYAVKTQPMSPTNSSTKDHSVSPPVGIQSSSPAGGQSSTSSPVETQDSLHFYREAAYLSCLSHPGLPEIYEVRSEQGYTFLVESLVSGKSLRERLRLKNLSFENSISMALALSSVLAKVHRFGLIHRDIKPENIIFKTDHQPVLLDFGLAALQNTQRLQQETAGTLNYCAPEQIGAIHRAVDTRADLYSLGAVLYESLVGRPPFVSDTQNGLIKKLSSEDPTVPSSLNSQVTPVLDELILKLLSKDPDDRIQSAEMLYKSLDEIRQDYEFPKDDYILVEASRHEDLIGRQAPLLKLRSQADLLAQGRGSLVVVRGQSGIGKTHLIQHFLNELRSSDHLVISAKATQGGNVVPFQTLREALESLCERIESLQNLVQRKRLFELLKASLLESADPVQSFTSGFVRILSDSGRRSESEQRGNEQRGNEQSSSSLTNQKQNRGAQYGNGLGGAQNSSPRSSSKGVSVSSEVYFRSLAEFFQKLSQKLGGLVLFLDDVQWLDEATQKFIKYLGECTKSSPIIFLGASRNDEESLESLLDLKKTLGRSLDLEIELGPFTLQESVELMSSLLGDRKLPEAFQQLIFSRSQGNPFAVVQYVRSLLDAGHLIPQAESWIYRNEGVGRIDLPQDVISIVLTRIESLSVDSKEVLRLAALWGARFSKSMLMSIFDFSDLQMDQTLAKALQLNLIEASDKDNEYVFIHDRIQEAFLRSISDDAKTNLHLRIAEHLQNTQDFLDQWLYQRADHLPGAILNSSMAQAPSWALATYRKAAQQAFSEFAIEESYKYSLWAIDLQKKSQRDPDFFDLKLCAQAGALTGHADEALEIFLALSKMKLSKAELARLNYEIIRIFVYRRQIDTAWKYTEQGLHLSGMWTVNFFGNLVRVILQSLLGIVFEPLERFIFKRQGQQLEESQAAAKIAEAGGVTAYFLNHPLKFAAVVFPSVFHALRLGVCAELSFAYAAAAAGYAVIGWNRLAQRYIQKALAHAEGLRDPYLLTRISLYKVFVLQFTNHWNEALQLVQKLVLRQGKYLDGQDFLNATYGGVSAMALVSGHHREGLVAMTEALSYLQLHDKRDLKKTGHAFLATLVPLLASQGRLQEATGWLPGLKVSTTSTPDDFSGNLGYYASLLALFYETDEDSQAIDEALREGRKKTPFGPLLCMPHFKFYYVFGALCRTLQVRRLLSSEKEGLHDGKLQKLAGPELSNLKESRDELYKASRLPSWKPLRGYVFLCDAVLVISEGQYAKAGDYLQAALKESEIYNLPQLRFEVSFWKAKLCQWKEYEDSCRVFVNEALMLCLEMGWVLKRERLQKDFPQIVESTLRKFSPLTSLQGPSRSHLEQEAFLSPSQGSSENSVEVTKMQKQLETLVEICADSIGVLHPEEQARRLLDRIVDYFSPDRALLFLGDGVDKELQFFMGRDLSKQDIHESQVLNYSRNTLATVVRTKKPLVIGAQQSEGEAFVPSESFVASQLRSVLLAPLLVKDRVLGVLYLDNKAVRGLFSDLDLPFITSVAGALAASLETNRAARLEIERAQLKQDVDLLAAVQKLLLPRFEVHESEKVTAQGAYFPAAQVGGDWWWAETVGDSTFVFVGDVTGHGTASAMVTALLAGAYHTFRSLVLESPRVLLAQTQESGEARLAELIEVFLKSVDATIFKQTQGEFLVPFAAVLVNHRSRNVRFWGAGSPSIILKSLNSSVDSISCFGDPLGSGQGGFSVQAIKNNFVGMVLVYTDGLHEIVGPKGNLFSERQLQRIYFSEALSSPVEQNTPPGLYQSPKVISSSLNQFIQAQQIRGPLRDDVTFVIVEVR